MHLIEQNLMKLEGQSNGFYISSYIGFDIPLRVKFMLLLEFMFKYTSSTYSIRLSLCFSSHEVYSVYSNVQCYMPSDYHIHAFKKIAYFSRAPTFIKTIIVQY